ARAGLHDRVRRHALRLLSARRVPGDVRRLRHRRHLLPRRLDGTRPRLARPGLDGGEDAHPGLLLHLDPGHPAPASLRPAHGPRLEGDAAAGDAEHPRDGGDRDGELMEARLNTGKTDWTAFPYLENQEDVIAVQRGPKPGGVAGAYRAFGETLRGLRTTFG